MNTLLWILQGILAVKMISTAFTHIFQHDLKTMREAIRTLGGSAEPLLYLSGALSLAAGAALLIPALKPSLGRFLPYTAAFLGLVVLTSLVIHITAREQPKVFVSLALIVLAAFLAYGRWVLAPL